MATALPGVTPPPVFPKRTIVCLCGSTKFYQAFAQANADETLAGKIVLSVGFFLHSTHHTGIGPRVISPHEKENLDSLHMSKIDLADEILVLNVGDYIGMSTRRETWYAFHKGKSVRFLEKIHGAREINSWFANWGAWSVAASAASIQPSGS